MSMGLHDYSNLQSNVLDHHTLALDILAAFLQLWVSVNIYFLQRLLFGFLVILVRFSVILCQFSLR